MRSAAELLRSIWFDNEKGAAYRLPAEDRCQDCDTPCETACAQPGEVPLRRLMRRLRDEVTPRLEIAAPENEDRLRCDFCGIPLENPFLLSSSVVANTYDMCARAFEAGWAGAGSVQVTTAVMQYGYRIIDELRAGLNLYLAEKGFNSIQEAVGLALDAISETTDVLERDTVIFPRFQREKCIGCGRCAISCADGGHRAIRLDTDRKPILDGKKCVGCHLCVLVCPQRDIVPGRKRINGTKE